MRIAAKVAQKTPAREAYFFPLAGPALRRHVPHAPTQLRLARTHERIEIEIEIDFPVTGVGQAGLAPLNLRYVYIYIERESANTQLSHAVC